MAANLFDDLHRGPPHCLDGLSPEQVGEHPPDEQPHDDPDVEDVEAFDHWFTRLLQLDIDRLEEGEEQRKGGDRSRADGKPLGDGRRRVAKGIELVGSVAHLGGKMGHLGDAAGVVGDRPVRIDRHRDTQCCQHSDGGNGDAVDATVIHRQLTRPECGAHAGCDNDDGVRRRLHPLRHP